MAYCHATSKTLKDSEFEKWVLREMVMQTEEGPISLDGYGQMVAPFDYADNLPERDLGSLDEVVKTHCRVLAQTYNTTAALQRRTLLIRLPDEYWIGASHPPTHLHTHNELLPREFILTSKRDLVQNNDIPQSTIALEFPDRATKELARVTLSKVIWQKTGHPPARLVINDYPRHGMTDETRNVVWIIQIVGRIFVKDLALLILDFLPQAGRSAVYEISPNKSRLRGVHVARLPIERCPEWVGRWASASDAPGSFYICAYPLQLCQHCPSPDDRLPELSGVDITLQFEDGLNPKTLLNSDQNSASFIAESEVPESTAGLPAELSRVNNNCSPGDFFLTFVGEYMSMAPNHMFRLYQQRVLEHFRYGSADDKIAVYRNVSPYPVSAAGSP